MATRYKYKYRLKFLPEALAEFQALDGSIREKFKKLLARRLDNPHVPGSALKGPLKGAYKIKLLKEGFRLAYLVQDEELVVMVVAAGKRDKSAVYEAAAVRVKLGKPFAKAAEGGKPGEPGGAGKVIRLPNKK